VYGVSRLSDIAIRIEAPVRIGGLGGGVAAVLSELAGMLDNLVQGGEAATIDLRSLPMSPEDRSELQSALGQGEIRATLNAEGLSVLQETGVSGVWWIEHRNRDGDLIAELIEVTAFPQILGASIEEMTASASALRNITARANHAILR
jgi:hydrogenase-1 operon protein HyaF